MSDVTSPAIERLRASIATEEAARKEAAARLTETDQEEIRLRAERDAARDAREAQEEVARRLDLARREDAAREARPGENVRGYAVKGYPDTFVLVGSGKAHSAWQDKLRKIHSGNKSIDEAAAFRTYAVAVVIDWNGTTEFTVSGAGLRLQAFMAEHPAIATSIVHVASELAGALEQEKKDS